MHRDLLLNSKTDVYLSDIPRGEWLGKCVYDNEAKQAGFVTSVETTQDGQARIVIAWFGIGPVSYITKGIWQLVVEEV